MNLQKMRNYIPLQGYRFLSAFTFTYTYVIYS